MNSINTTNTPVISQSQVKFSSNHNNNNNNLPNHHSLTNLHHPTTTYFAVISDSSTFNRNLNQNRNTRLPFLDLATQILQKPAPWLYRTIRELPSDDASNNSSHVIIHYSRHRWHLDYQLGNKKKHKASAQKLWFTLQNALKVLGIPRELFPVIAKRAYTIAGLPLPSNLVHYFETVNPKLSLSSNLSVTARVTQSGLKLPLNNQSDKICTDDLSNNHEKESITESNLQDNGGDRSNASGEESTQSSDGLSGQKRVKNNPTNGNSNGGQTEDVTFMMDTKLTTNDALFVDHKKTSLNFKYDGKIYDLTIGSELDHVKDESHPSDNERRENMILQQDTNHDYSDDDGLPDEMMDEEDETDVEWFLSSKRRKYKSKLPNHGMTSSSGSNKSAKHSLKSLQSKSSSSTYGNKSFQNYSHLGNRLTSKRIPKRHLGQCQRILGGRTRVIKGNDDRWTGLMNESTECHPGNTSTVHSSLGLRRGGRPLTARLNGNKYTIAHVSKSSTRFENDQENPGESLDHWDSLSEPGFQLNLISNHSPAQVLGQQQHNKSDVIDCGYLDQYQSSNNIYPTSNNLNGVVSNCNTLNHSTFALHPLVNNVQDPIDNRLSRSPPSRTSQPRQLPSSSSAVLWSSGSSSCPTTNMGDTCPTELRETISSRESIVTNNLYACSSSSSSSSVPTNNRGSNVSTQQSVPIIRSNPLEKDNSLDRGKPTEYSSPTSIGKSDRESFLSPQTATTIVTFFVCEVCASRYRSTAGLRYHYHSQHSGYTPQSPISASASRLLVPIGEERGVGGGLRGGRPRRHRGGMGNTKTRPSKVGNPDLEHNPCDADVSNTDPGLNYPANPVTLSSRSFAAEFKSQSSKQQQQQKSTTNQFYYGNLNEDQIDNRNKNDAPLHNRCPPSDSVLTMMMVNNNNNNMRHDSPKMYSHQHSTANASSPSIAFGGRSSGQNNWTHSQYFSSHNNNNSNNSNNNNNPATGPLVNRVNSCAPSLLSKAPSALSFANRLNPQQRRYERQNCPNPYYAHSNPNHSTCVYCLGTDQMNPRFGGYAEPMLQCSRCKQFAHYSCLNMPTSLIQTCLSYPWQCIICKTCWLCDQDGNEDRMLFCGDCDRAFHIYCLPNPINQYPNHYWSCDICLHELYGLTKAYSNSENQFSVGTQSQYEPPTSQHFFLNNQSQSTPQQLDELANPSYS